MKILITGLNGTLAPRLAEAARAAGHEVVGWDRNAVNPDDEAASAAWLGAQSVDAIAHLGMSSARFCGWLASRCPNFLFTGTVMVFENEPDGLYRGPVELADGRVVPGILYRRERAVQHPDITEHGGWREYLAVREAAPVTRG